MLLSPQTQELINNIPRVHTMRLSDCICSLSLRSSLQKLRRNSSCWYQRAFDVTQLFRWAVLRSLRVVKDGATTKGDAYNMAENNKLESIIMKLYYQEMVTFQLRETKGLRFGYTKQRWNLLMRLKVGQQSGHVGRCNQNTVSSLIFLIRAPCYTMRRWKSAMSLSLRSRGLCPIKVLYMKETLRFKSSNLKFALSHEWNSTSSQTCGKSQLWFLNVNSFKYPVQICFMF